MKRTLLLVLMASMLTGCVSPTIDAWADRGLQGVDLSKENITEFADVLQQQLDAQQNRDIDAVFDDILSVAKGQIPGVEIDEAWIAAHKIGLKLLLAAIEADQEALDTATLNAIGNLDSVAEAFNQIKKLRRSWSQTDEMQAQIDRLSALILQLLDKGD